MTVIKAPRSFGEARVTRSRLRGWAAIGACASTLVAVAARPLLPRLPAGLDYSRGYAPWWVTIVVASLGMLAVGSSMVAPGMLRRAVVTVGWGACAGLLWSAAGVVLDGFRSFFWLTGIPAGDFSRVDWWGFLTRALALVAVALAGPAILSYQRATRFRCPGCGRDPSARTRPTAWLGYTAFALGFPYPLLKLYWWAGGGLVRPDVYHEGFPYGEVIALICGAALSLSLVQRWGRVFPRRVPFLGGRRVPRRMPLSVGWAVTAVLVTMGVLSVFGTIAQVVGMTDGPVRFDGAAAWAVVMVYGSWLLFGLALGGATLAYQRQTLPPCVACGL